jgi:uncharacterized protein
MLINLSKVLSIPSHKEDFSIPLEMDAVHFMRGTYPILDKQEVHLHVENTGRNQLHVEADTKITLALTCDRCLDEVPWTCEIQLEKEYDKSDRDDEWNQESFIEENNLDVGRLISAELLPKIPMKVLCKDDCKGICPVCGTNRNKRDCGCDQSVPDPRMAVIQDIFKNFKEV